MYKLLTESQVFKLLSKLGYTNNNQKYNIRKDRKNGIYQVVDEKTRVPVLILDRTEATKNNSMIIKYRSENGWTSKEFPKDFYTEPDEMGYQFYLGYFEEHEDIATWFVNDLAYIGSRYDNITQSKNNNNEELDL